MLKVRIAYRRLSIFATIFFLFSFELQAKDISEVLMANFASGSPKCEVAAAPVNAPMVLNEIFPKVIEKTPGGDAGARQLFYPIRNIAEPLALLGTRCLIENRVIGNKNTGFSSDQKLSCMEFTNWVELLVANDALYFDREKHKKSSVSFVTGTLSGNLTLRPVALYISLLRDMGFIKFKDNSAVNDWLKRRAENYSNVPSRLTSAAAQNLVLNSALTKLFVGVSVNKPKPALAEASNVYRLYIDNARGDGSFPLETRRGQSALKYSNMAVSGLVMLAEIAAMQGVDLYGYKSHTGNDIHTSVRFLAMSFSDESLILEYAKENYAPTDKNFGNGVEQSRNFTRDHLGWINIYIKRFPNSENALLLDKVKTLYKTRSSGLYDETISGFPNCLW
jgi:hypothetical protein